MRDLLAASDYPPLNIDQVAQLFKVRAVGAARGSIVACAAVAEGLGAAQDRGHHDLPRQRAAANNVRKAHARALTRHVGRPALARQDAGRWEH